jgi:hypothetical protein
VRFSYPPAHGRCRIRRRSATIHVSASGTSPSRAPARFPGGRAPRTARASRDAPVSASMKIATSSGRCDRRTPPTRLRPHLAREPSIPCSRERDGRMQDRDASPGSRGRLPRRGGTLSHRRALRMWHCATTDIRPRRWRRPARFNGAARSHPTPLHTTAPGHTLPPRPHSDAGMRGRWGKARQRAHAIRRRPREARPSITRAPSCARSIVRPRPTLHVGVREALSGARRQEFLNFSCNASRSSRATLPPYELRERSLAP